MLVAVSGCFLTNSFDGLECEGAACVADAGGDALGAGDVVRIVDPGPDASAPARPPSCEGLPATCGSTNDCCEVRAVAGGTFARNGDAKLPATVTGFGLDRYEITVGRFRAFVRAGRGTQALPPSAGDGANAKIPGSGWTDAFTSSLVADAVALTASLKCDATYQTWTDEPGPSETRPINCLSWFEAFAFCIWDGGRLPTELEWGYAAAGGNIQRQFPWGNTFDPARVNYECTGDGSDAGVCGLADILAVGAKSPGGDGVWGQSDLVGNVSEWVLDYEAPQPTECVDCANLDGGAQRIVRGGSFAATSPYVRSTSRSTVALKLRGGTIGARCARAL